jgi:hypothetical protein
MVSALEPPRVIGAAQYLAKHMFRPEPGRRRAGVGFSSRGLPEVRA